MPTGVYKHHLHQGFQKGNKIWLGRKQTKEHIKKGIKARKGYSHTQETKRKISKALKGKTSWKKGMKLPSHSEEHKRKISRIAKEKGFGKWMKNRHFPKETREKMSEAKKGKMPKNCTEEWKLKGRLKLTTMKEPTSIEKKVYDELKSRGLLFEKQKLINGKFLVDAYIPNLNLVIECDGDYWHSLPKAIKRDELRNAYLKKYGFNLLRMTETEINNDSFKNKLDKEIE